MYKSKHKKVGVLPIRIVNFTIRIGSTPSFLYRTVDGGGGGGGRSDNYPQARTQKWPVKISVCGYIYRRTVLIIET